MFEYLPEITEDSYKVFVDRELEDVVSKVDKYNDELWQKNYYLAKAVQGGAITAGEGLEGQERRLAEGWAVAAQLAVLRLIDRAIQAQKMEVMLSEKTTKERK